MKVSLIISTLNEIDGMRVIMPQIKREWYDELIIVDGGSTDGTLEYAKSNGYFIFVQKEKGYGPAFREALGKSTGDIAVIFSPDGNSVPEKIPELVAKVKEGYDIVICSRYLRGAKSCDDDPVTAFGNWMFSSMTSLLFWRRFTDTLVMYRAFRKHLIDDLEVDFSTPSWGSSLLLRAARKNFRIAEIPGSEPVRIGGKRKMRPLINGAYELLVVFREFFRKTKHQS